MYTIEKGFKMVELEGKRFKDEQGYIISYNRGSYGFYKNGLYVASKCKSAGGSSLPLAYDAKVANELIQSGFVKEELTYCKEII